MRAVFCSVQDHWRDLDSTLTAETLMGYTGLSRSLVRSTVTCLVEAGFLRPPARTWAMYKTLRPTEEARWWLIRRVVGTTLMGRGVAGASRDAADPASPPTPAHQSPCR